MWGVAGREDARERGRDMGAGRSTLGRSVDGVGGRGRGMHEDVKADACWEEVGGSGGGGGSSYCGCEWESYMDCVGGV